MTIQLSDFTGVAHTLAQQGVLTLRAEQNTACINLDMHPTAMKNRKRVFPQLQSWLNSVKTAFEDGLITGNEKVNIHSYVKDRATNFIAAQQTKVAVEVTKAATTFKPRLPIVITKTVEVVPCDENGRPLTEVQAEQIAELQGVISAYQEALEESSDTVAQAIVEIEARDATIESQQNQIKSLNKTIKKKNDTIKSIQAGIQAFNQVVNTKPE